MYIKDYSNQLHAFALQWWQQENVSTQIASPNREHYRNALVSHMQQTFDICILSVNLKRK